MEQKIEDMNIYQRLAKIRKPVEILQKNKDGYGYTYVSEDLILANITGLMDKYHVSLVPNVCSGTIKVEPYTYTKTKRTKNSEAITETVNEILVSADMVWKWINNDNPSDTIEVPWALVGQQSDAAQAFGSGLSYSSRYFMLKYFNVATSNDDPDEWRSKQKQAEQFEQREVARSIIEKLHLTVQQFLEKNPNARQSVSDTVKKFARDKNGKPSPNYMIIEDPDVAAGLSEAIAKLVEENK